MKKMFISFLLGIGLYSNTVYAVDVTIEEKIVGLYVAFFNRAADMSGLEYWNQRAKTASDANKTSSDILKELSAGFATHPTFISTYSHLDNKSFVEEIYRNVLGRDGDSEGIAYWTNRISLDPSNPNYLSRSDMVSTFVEVALEFDRNDPQYANLSEEDLLTAQIRQNLLANKVETGLRFTQELGELSNIVDENGDPIPDTEVDKSPAYLASIKILEGINEDHKSVEEVMNFFATDSFQNSENKIELINISAIIPFKIEVKTDNDGTTADNQFEIPIESNKWKYSYNVDCNSDGIYEATGIEENYICTYSKEGNYTISITGLFPQIYFAHDGDRKKLIDIQQWSNGKWLSMEDSFSGCENTTMSAVDTPDLTEVNTTRRMFYNALMFDGNISDWDVSHITDMFSMFNSASIFNQPIGDWNVSNVIDMSGMFFGAKEFNQNINQWNVGHVKSMNNMFSNAVKFNQPIGDWNVSSVTNMAYMFNAASEFNQPIGDWDVSHVTNMEAMFANAYSFNQDISKWDVSSVKNMSYMFYSASSFSNHDLSQWDVYNVTLYYNFSKDMGSNNILPQWRIFNSDNGL